MVCVIKLDAGVSWQAYIGNEHATTGSQIAIGRHSSGDLATYGDGGVATRTAVAHSSTDGWVLVGSSHPAGTSTLTHVKHPIGGAQTSANPATTLGNPVTQVGGKIVFGQIDGSDFFKGRLAVCAEWASALNTTQLAALVSSFTRSDWLATSPVGLWDELDAFQADHTGGGASRTSITGTTDDADDPAGWASWAGAAVVEIPSLVMAPPIAA
jgi:hypothetical protein